MRKRYVNIERVCAWCNKQFIAHRKDGFFCHKRCSASSANHQRTEPQRAQKAILKARKRMDALQLKNNIYEEIQNFIYTIKRRGYFATQIDIFILIDLFDRLYPGRNIPYFNDSDKSFNSMFYKVCLWYKTEKDKRTELEFIIKETSINE